jgi:hypothetical protein
MSNWVETAGKFPVKRVVDGGWQTSSKGNNYIELILELEVNGENKWSTYRGFFTEKTMQITAKEMSFLGFVGEPSDLMDGSDGLFNVPENVTATVEQQEGDNGKMYYRVSWINMLTPRKPSADKQTIMNMIEKNNLNGLFMKFKSQTTEKYAENFQKNDNNNVNNNESDDVGF